MTPSLVWSKTIETKIIAGKIGTPMLALLWSRWVFLEGYFLGFLGSECVYEWLSEAFKLSYHRDSNRIEVWVEDLQKQFF